MVGYDKFCSFNHLDAGEILLRAPMKDGFAAINFHGNPDAYQNISVKTTIGVGLRTVSIGPIYEAGLDFVMPRFPTKTINLSG